MSQGRLLQTVRYPIDEAIRILGQHIVAARAGDGIAAFQISTTYGVKDGAVTEFVFEVREAPKREIA